MEFKNIKSFEDACTKLGISSELPVFPMAPEKHQSALIAHYKLVIIAAALNDGWEPNWNDRSQWKYYFWPEIEATKENPAGVGFSLYGFDASDTISSVGSRLCYKSREMAIYAGQQFSDLYKEYFLIG